MFPTLDFGGFQICYSIEYELSIVKKISLVVFFVAFGPFLSYFYPPMQANAIKNVCSYNGIHRRYYWLIDLKICYVMINKRSRTIFFSTTVKPRNARTFRSILSARVTVGQIRYYSANSLFKADSRDHSDLVTSKKKKFAPKLEKKIQKLKISSNVNLHVALQGSALIKSSNQFIFIFIYCTLTNPQENM